MKKYFASTILSILTLSAVLLSAEGAYENVLNGIKSHDYSEVYNALGCNRPSLQELGQLIEEAQLQKKELKRTATRTKLFTMGLISPLLVAPLVYGPSTFIQHLWAIISQTNQSEYSQQSSLRSFLNKTTSLLIIVSGFAGILKGFYGKDERLEKTRQIVSLLEIEREALLRLQPRNK